MGMTPLAPRCVVLFVCWFITFGLGTGLPSGLAAGAVAQPPQSEEREASPAILAFECEPSALARSSFVKSSRLIPAGLQRELFEESTSLRGTVSFPQNIGEFMRRQQASENVFDFYLQYTLKTDVEKSKSFQRIVNQAGSTQIREEDNTRYFRIEGSPPYQVMVADRELVIASLNYSDRLRDLPPVTSRLKGLLKDPPRADAYVAMDVSAMQPLLESVNQLPGAALPPSLAAMRDAALDLEWGDLTVEVDESAFLSGTLSGRNKEAAEKMATLLEELLDQGKQASRPGAPNEEVQRKILESVKIKTEGPRVQITLEIDESVAKMSQEAAVYAQLTNNQRQAVISFHNFHDAYGRFPFLADEGQSPELSWRVRVLPFLNEKPLYDQFDLSQAWNSPANRKVLENLPMPAIFGDAGDKTNLAWVKSDVARFDEITNGSSNTIAFIYTDQYVPWTQNNDVTPEDVMRQFKALRPGESIIASFYDGSVRRISAETDLATFEAMLFPRKDD